MHATSTHMHTHTDRPTHTQGSEVGGKKNCVLITPSPQGLTYSASQHLGTAAAHFFVCLRLICVSLVVSPLAAEAPLPGRRAAFAHITGNKSIQSHKALRVIRVRGPSGRHSLCSPLLLIAPSWQEAAVRVAHQSLSSGARRLLITGFNL